jgi:hypothetical protein
MAVSVFSLMPSSVPHEMPSLAGTDLITWLAGTWTVERDINDGHGSFHGEATFTPDPDGTALTWHEEGTMTLGELTLPATRTLTLDAAGHISFSNGLPFHDLALTDGACDAFHPCGPDAYTGRYERVDDDTLLVTWHVKGPRKDDVLVSRYARRV